jgi:hypothetical protein
MKLDVLNFRQCAPVEQLCCTPVRASACVGAGLPANELAKALRAQSLPQT